MQALKSQINWVVLPGGWLWWSQGMHVAVAVGGRGHAFILFFSPLSFAFLWIPSINMYLFICFLCFLSFLSIFSLSLDLETTKIAHKGSCDIKKINNSNLQGPCLFLDIEDIYSFAVNTINIVIECNENISIFTSAKHEWKFECFHYTRWKFLWHSLKKSKFSFYFIFLHATARFWRHILRHQTKHERHGVDVQCLTCETLERQKQKVSANQNHIDTKMFLTF